MSSREIYLGFKYLYFIIFYLKNTEKCEDFKAIMILCNDFLNRRCYSCHFLIVNGLRAGSEVNSTGCPSRGSKITPRTHMHCTRFQVTISLTSSFQNSWTFNNCLTKRFSRFCASWRHMATDGSPVGPVSTTPDSPPQSRTISTPGDRWQDLISYSLEPVTHKEHCSGFQKF